MPPSRRLSRVTKVTLALLVPAALLLSGCTSRKDVVETYAREGTAARQDQRGTDAEAFFLSAVERARPLDAATQSDALWRLGAFYREQGRFRDAVAPLTESLELGVRSGRIDRTDLARRRIELAKAYAVLNRWNDGRNQLRDASEGLAGLSAPEAADARELIEVYRERLQGLGSSTDGLP